MPRGRLRKNAAGVFPARVGMNRVAARSVLARADVPRVRGDEPWYAQATKKCGQA